MVDIQNSFQVGSKVTIAQDTDLRGQITIGSGTILHPKCTIVAMGGPIEIGTNCIIEDNVVIVNRQKRTMVIGDYNLFQVGCRIESPSIGSYNIFGHKCRVSHSVTIGSNCNIGTGCNVISSPFPLAVNEALDQEMIMSASPIVVTISPVDSPSIPTTGPPSSTAASPALGSRSPRSPQSSSPMMNEILPDYSVVFGSENRRRIWSGEGSGQARALHVKHLDYLREVLPRHNKLRIFA